MFKIHFFHKETPHSVSQTLTHITRFSTRIIAIVLFFLAFILALEFIKVGVGSFSENLKNNINIYLTGPFSSLGVGWVTSFLTLNSTSIATIGINLTGHGILEYMDGFFLILGSRIGAAAIILILGIIFYFKGQSYRRSINVGLITFLAILSTSLLAIFFGRIIHLLNIDNYVARSLHSPGQGPIINFISESFTHDAAIISINTFGPIITFLLGFIMIVLVIELLDKVFYIIDFSTHDFEKNPLKHKIVKLLHTPLFAFLIGAIISALTLSITISMSILIPIYTHESLRNKIKEIFTREHGIVANMLIPYALGANIGSFIDTLIFAKIFGSIVGLALVYNVIISSLLAVILIFLVYRIFSDLVIKISNWALSKPAYLPEIIILLIALPLLFVFH